MEFGGIDENIFPSTDCNAPTVAKSIKDVLACRRRGTPQTSFPLWSMGLVFGITTRQPPSGGPLLFTIWGHTKQLGGFEP